MDSNFFTDLAITETIRERFAKKIEITRMLVRDIQVGPVAHASVFRVKGGNVYILIRGSNEMTLGEIIRIVRNMGAEVDDFVPPSGVENYFDDKALEKYKAVFPGKPLGGSEELRYYRTLVPYTPALVRVARIRGELREYEPEARRWNVVKRLSYNKIDTKE